MRNSRMNFEMVRHSVIKKPHVFCRC